MIRILLAAYRDFEDRVDMVSEKLPSLKIVRRACMQKIGKFTKTDLMALCPTIGKSSVENVIKKLIEEGVLVKHGTGRAACCRKNDAEQAIDAHERWYLVYGRLPRKFPN